MTQVTVINHIKLSQASMIQALAAAIVLGMGGVNANKWTNNNSSTSFLSLGNVDTVDALDVNAYVGHWFQMYADELVLSTIEPDAYCVTADYALQEDGSISVHNYQTTGSPTEGVSTIDGSATVEDPSEPGKLSVQFDSVGTAAAPYWVLELGPLNESGLYDWSIVSDPFLGYLFVLARDVDKFNTNYDEDVKDKLKELGFTKKYNSPIATYQQDDCIYED